MYVSHMRPPYGTSIYDVEDPRRPRLLASLEVPIGWHSHKRVRDGLMIVNYEKFRSGADDFGGGLGIYDVSRPDRPRLITHWKTGTQGGGVHRYDFDGRYAHISPTAPGYIGNIVKILTCAIRRSRGSGALVDSRPARGRRRNLSLGQLRAAALPPSAAHGQPPVRVVLASRHVHPGHRGHGAPAPGVAVQHRAGPSASHAHGAAHTGVAQGPPDPGGGGRGRGCGRRRRPSPGSSTSRTSASPCRSPPSRSTWTLTASRRSHVRLSPAGREVQRQCAALRLVRARPAAAGHQRSVPAARSGLLRARPAGRLRTRVVQRRHHRRPRAALPAGPAARPGHHRKLRLRT